MTYNKLDQITPDEIVAGIKIVLENARDLFSDGDLLYKEKKFSRAYTLFQFAIEEIGKSRLLYSLLMAIKNNEKIDYKNYNKEFTNHQKKSKGAIVFETLALMLMFKGEKVESKRTTIKKAYQDLLDEENNVEQINDNKNFSLYVSTIDNRFVKPDKLITEEMATKLRTNALIRLSASTQFLDWILKNIDILSANLKKITDDPNHSFDADFSELLLSGEK